MSEERGKKKKPNPVIYSGANVGFCDPGSLGWKEGGGQTGSEAESFKVTWEIGMLSSH